MTKPPGKPLEIDFVIAYLVQIAHCRMVRTQLDDSLAKLDLMLPEVTQAQAEAMINEGLSPLVVMIELGFQPHSEVDLIQRLGETL